LFVFANLDGFISNGKAGYSIIIGLNQCGSYLPLLETFKGEEGYTLSLKVTCLSTTGSQAADKGALSSSFRLAALSLGS
jgi:hypothetical protein